MDLINSQNINNRIKKRTVAIAVIMHLYLAIFTFGLSLLLLAIAGFVTSMLLEKDINEAKSTANSFNKNFPFRHFAISPFRHFAISPFRHFGHVFGSFQHIFNHAYSIEKDISSAIEGAIKTKIPITSVNTLSVIDTDPDLKNCEQRRFIKAESAPTSRGTGITLILNQSSYGSMRSIQWRVLAGGYLDRNAKFNLIAYSLFTILFWIRPYFKRETDLISRVRTIYSSAYNDMDVATQVRCLHEVVFDEMITELDKNGIDTSELKVQKMQVMNINISGGKVNMGNVVQGAMNKISGVAKGAKV